MTIRSMFVALVAAPVLVSASPAWTTGVYTVGENPATDFAPAANNLLAGVAPNANSSISSSGMEGCASATILTDGSCIKIKSTSDYYALSSIGNNSVIEYTLLDGETPCALQELRIYSAWRDSGRDRISIASVEALDSNGVWTTIGGSVDYDNDSFHNCAVLSGANAALATDAVGLRITFGAQENNWAGYAEIELIGNTADKPMTTLSNWTVGTAAASATLALPFCGTDASSCDVTLSYCRDGMESPIVLSFQDLADGDTRAISLNVVPGAVYTYDIYVTNNLGVATAPQTGTFRTQSEGFPVMFPGLWQAKLNGQWNTTDGLDASVIPVIRTLGAPMGQNWFNEKDTYVNVLDGVETELSWGNYITYAYQGYIYLTEGTTYSFYTWIDDDGQITIDGTVVEHSTGCQAASGTYKPSFTGWHAIDIRVGNITGGIGNKGNGGVSYAFNGSGWMVLADDGTGTFLACLPEGGDAQSVTIASLVNDAGDVQATVRTDLPVPATLYAWYGSTYGGDTADGWEHVEAVASIDVTGPASLPLSLSLGTSTAFLRFAAVSDDDPSAVWATRTEVVPEHDIVATPAFSITSVTPGSNAADIGLLVSSLGADATSWTATADFGFAADALNRTETIAAGTDIGDIVAILPSLLPTNTYYVRVTLENNLGESVTGEVFSLETDAEEGFGLAPGLRQGRFNDVFNEFSAAPETAIDQRRELGAVMGLAKFGETGSFTSPLDGVKTSWNKYVTFVYTGYMFLEAGTTYAFGMEQDDSSFLKINGTVLIDSGATYCQTYTATYTPESTGWYPIDVRVGNATAGAGARSDQFNGKGVAYNANGVTDTNSSVWLALLDPGDGSLLRTYGPGESDFVAITDSAMDGTALVADVLVSYPGACVLYACYGATYGGTTMNDWEHTVPLATKASDDPATFPVRVPCDATDRYVRFFAIDQVSSEMFFTSDTVVLAVQSELDIQGPQVVLYDAVSTGCGSAALPLLFSTPGSGATSADLFLDFGTNAADLAFTDLVADDAQGYVADHVLNGLLPATTYYVRARVVNDLGETATTPAVSFTTLAESHIIYLPGLLQGRLSGAYNSTSPASDATETRRELGPVMGLYLATDVGTQPYTSELDGVQTYWGGNTTFIYTGLIYLQGGNTYAFGGDIDDDSAVWIDGTRVYHSSGNVFNSGTIAIANTGWHDIEVRVGNGSGYAGANTRWIGLGFNSVGNTASSGGWTQLKDAGDGALLCCPDSTGTPLLTILSAETDGDALVASVEVAVNAPVTLYAWQGPDYGAEDDSAWASCTVVANKLGSDTATLTFRLPLAADTRFVRFFAATSLSGSIRNTSETLATRALPAVADEARIELAFPSAPTMFGADITVNFLQAGSAGTGDIVLEYGTAADALDATFEVADGAAPGAYAATLANLRSHTTYYVRARVDFGGDETVSEVYSFTTATEPEYGCTIAGLMQGTISGGNGLDITTPLADAANVRRELGPVMAFVRDGAYESEIDGVSTRWAGNTAFLYEGYIYLDVGTSYAFGGDVDDMTRIEIDGNLIAYTTGNKFAAGLYSVTQSGWHPISIRLGNGTGNAGCNVRGTGTGVNDLGCAYNAAGDIVSGSASWLRLKDPGDGSLLRVSMEPDSSVLTVTSARMEGDILVADVRVAIGEAATLRVWTGATYGGIDDAAWDATATVTNLADGATVTLPLRLPLAEGTKYVRFFAERPDDASYRWTADSLLVDALETVGSDPIVLLTETEASSTPGAASAPVSIQSLGAGAATCDIVVRYGLTPSALAFTAEGASDVTSVGAYPVTLTALLPGRRYYVQACVSNNVGGEGLSEIREFDTPEFEEVGDVATANTECSPGLIQGRFDNGVWNDFSSDPSTAVDQRRELGPVMGFKSYSSTGTYTSDLDGVKTSWSENRTFVYTGYIHLVAGTEYTFGMTQDDSSYLKIADTVILNSGNSYCAAVSGTYTAAATGWYPIDVRVGNATANAGRYNAGVYGGTGVGYSVDGGTTWDYLRDSGDGSFLRTGLSSRSIDVVNSAVEDGSYTATLAVSTLADAGAWPLYVCYGGTYGGDDTNAWEHVDLVGAIPGTTDTVAFGPLTGAATDVRFVRFAFDSGDFGFNWSETQILLDPATPELDPEIEVSGLATGDHVVLTGALLSCGDQTCTLTAEVSRNADLSDSVLWIGTPATLNDSGDVVFDLYTNDTASAAYVVPGVTHYARIIAVGANGLVDTTPVVSFTPLAGTTIGRPSATALQRNVTVTTTLVLGANDTTVWLYTGTSADALAAAADVQPLVLDSEDDPNVSFTTLAPAYAAFYYAIVASNDCSTATWTSWSSGTAGTASGSITPVDNSTYYWKGSVHSGDWSDAANWEVVPADPLLTFPNSSSTDVSFERCTEEGAYRVHLDGSYRVKNATLGAANVGTDLTIWGGDKATSRLQTGEFSLAAGQTLVLDAIYLQLSGWLATPDNGLLAIRNGSEVYNTTEIWFTANGGTAEISGRSTVYTTGKLWLGGIDSLFVLDDADITAANLINCSFTGSNGTTVELRGARPRFISNKESSVTATDKTPGAMPTFRFVIPKGGYEEAPIQTPGSYVFFGAKASGATGQARFVVDADSPYFKGGEALRHQKLIEYRGGINTTYIDISNQSLSKGLTVRYTYGTDESATPSAEGELPTILWADIRGLGATILIFQ